MEEKRNSKKGRMVMIITIGLICLILSCVMFMQFKTINLTDITAIKNMRETELRAELTSWKAKLEEITKKYGELVNTRDEYRQKLSSNEETYSLLSKELNQANLLLGKTNVRGNGIVITLMDNNEADIEAYDILQLINELRIAGAEAISVNGQRVVGMTDVALISSGFIMMNGERLMSPYVVSAIGNQDDLESTLTRKRYGYMDNIIKGSNKTATIERKNNILITKYMGQMTLDYIEEKK